MKLHRFGLRIAVLFGAASGLLMLVATAGYAATITVNSTADVIANDGECTLREAILAANTNTTSGAMPGECAAGQALPTVDAIVFNIAGAGVHTITPGTPLPDIVQGVSIDGGNGGVATDHVQLIGLGTVGTGLNSRGRVPATVRFAIWSSTVSPRARSSSSASRTSRSRAISSVSIRPGRQSLQAAVSAWRSAVAHRASSSVAQTQQSAM